MEWCIHDQASDCAIHYAMAEYQFQNKYRPTRANGGPTDFLDNHFVTYVLSLPQFDCHKTQGCFLIKLKLIYHWAAHIYGLCITFGSKIVGAP